MTTVETFKILKARLKKRNKLVLLGAGAVMDIGAPATLCSSPNTELDCCLTHQVLNTGEFISSSERLIEVIYKEILQYNRKANFEDIIEFIENTILSLYQKNHYSYSKYYDYLNVIREVIAKRDSPLKSLLFSFEQTNQNVDHFYLKVLTDLLADVIDCIRKRVKTYQGKKNEEFDKLFVQWFKKDVLRVSMKSVNVYSLNYDNYLYELLKREGVKIELFEPGKESHDSKVKYFNLHGSANWKVNESKNPNSYEICSGIDDERSTIQVRSISDKKTVLSPIIAGREKVNKLYAQPFRRLVTSFSADCEKADEIYVIGYSFLDNHINSVFRDSLEKNPKAKVVVVNPSMTVDDFMEIIVKDLKYKYDKGNFHPINHNDFKVFEITGSNMRLFIQKFIDFLHDPRKRIVILNEKSN